MQRSLAVHFAAPVAAFAMLVVSSASAQEKEWSQEELERVAAEVEEEVAELRGTPFQRPVAVELTSRDAFLRYVRERLDRLQSPEDLKHEETTFKLLGLLPAEMDLLEVSLDLLEEQVGGYYDPARETFYLMEGFTGGIARAILAHELTHALDDQLYDLDRNLEARMDRTDAVTAYSAVVEGSGTSVMNRWVLAHLGQIDPAELEKLNVSTESLSSLPPAVWKPLLAVYLQGQKFLDHGYRASKKRRGKRDANLPTQLAFARPPRSMEQVLHPEKYWDPEERDEPREVSHEVGSLPPEWEELDRDVLGELHLALLTELAEEPREVDFSNQFAVLSIAYTNRAAAGWDGDEALLLGRGNARFLHLVTVWDRPEDADQFATAVEAARSRIEEVLRGMSEDEESGLRVIRDPAQPDVVRYLAWWGASAREVESVRVAVSVRVAPAEELATPPGPDVESGSNASEDAGKEDGA